MTKIYEPEQGLLNSFARPFTAWEDMPVSQHNAKIHDLSPNLHL